MAEITSTTPPKFLTAEWRNIVLVNFACPREVLKSRVPAGTELDTWNDQAFVSLVGFQFLDARVRGMAIPCHRNFPEVNLRFYVRRKVAGTWRHGVTFIREIAPRRAVAIIARRWYRENYITLPMRAAILPPGVDGRGMFAYEWRVGERWNHLSAEFSGPAGEVARDSMEAYFLDNYWGYSAWTKNVTLEYGVEHAPWKVWHADRAELDADLETLYGAALAKVLRGTPNTVLVADGSAVVVRRGCRLAGR